MYTARCPHCGARFNFRASSIGTLHRCNVCGGKTLLNAPPVLRRNSNSLGLILAIGLTLVVGFVFICVLVGLSHTGRDHPPPSYTYNPAPSPHVAYSPSAPSFAKPPVHVAQPAATKSLFDTSPASPQATPAPATQPSRLDELNAQLVTAQANVAQAQRALDAAMQNSATRLQTDPEYQAAAKELSDLDAKVKDLREQQSSDIDLSERWMAAKNRVSHFKQNDPAVVAADNNLYEQQRALSLLLSQIADEKKRIAAEMAVASAPPVSASTDNQASQPPSDGSYVPGGTYVGPRGGVYHYSKNGKKVYNKH